MHMIPACADIERKLDALHAGHLIKLRATLVEVNSDRRRAAIISATTTDCGDLT